MIAALADYDWELDNMEEDDADDVARVAEIKADYGELAEEIRELENAGIEDWSYGATLIREDHFEDYARQFAEDIGAINSDASWPYTCIDWERAARELQMDYTSVEFGD